jgi:hypothetical protein
MHVNTDPPGESTPKKPCLRDMHELVRDHLPCAVVKLTPKKQLKRRVNEIVASHPRFREEAPLVLAHELHRRARHGGLQRANSLMELPTQKRAHSHG